MRTVSLLSLMALAMLLLSNAFSENSDSGSRPGQWKFAVLCDTRGDDINSPNKTCINDTFTRALAEEIARSGCDLVLVAGDLVNGVSNNGSTSFSSQFKNWKSAMQPLYNAGVEVYPVRGNHENGHEISNLTWPPILSPPPKPPETEPGIIEAFLGAFNESYIPRNGPKGETGLTYSFAHKNAFFIGLDEYINPHRVNQVWLDNQLENNVLPHVFVFGHEPAFKITHPGCLAYYSKERDAFWENLGQGRAKIYFCGHDHLYNRAHINDSSGCEIYQMVTGSGGAPMERWTPPYSEGERVVGDYHDDIHSGYVQVTVDNGLVEVEWRALVNGSWETLDSFSYSLSASQEESAGSNASAGKVSTAATAPALAAA
jgi:hypothetical protein